MRACMRCALVDARARTSRSTPSNRVPPEQSVRDAPVAGRTGAMWKGRLRWLLPPSFHALAGLFSTRHPRKCAHHLLPTPTVAETAPTAHTQHSCAQHNPSPAGHYLCDMTPQQKSPHMKLQSHTRSHTARQYRTAAHTAIRRCVLCLAPCCAPLDAAKHCTRHGTDPQHHALFQLLPYRRGRAAVPHLGLRRASAASCLCVCGSPH